MQEDILQLAKASGQGHLVDHYHSIQDAKAKQQFLNQLKGLDFKQTNQLYKDVYLHHKNNPNANQPVNFAPLKNVINRKEI